MHTQRSQLFHPVDQINDVRSFVHFDEEMLALFAQRRLRQRRALLFVIAVTLAGVILSLQVEVANRRAVRVVRGHFRRHHLNKSCWFTFTVRTCLVVLTFLFFCWTFGFAPDHEWNLSERKRGA